MKIQILNYQFDAANQQIIFNDFDEIRLDSVLLVTNVTTNTIIYNFANNDLGGVVNGNELTLNFDTTAMSNSDPLQIFYDDGLLAVPSGLVDALYDLVQSLQFLTAVRGNLADLRVQLTAAPVALTSVTTIGALSTKGLRQIDVGTEPKDLSNIVAIQSNINNITL